MRLYRFMQLFQQLLLSTALSLMIAPAGLSASSTENISEETLIEVIQNCQNLPEAYRQDVYARCAGGNAAVSLFRPQEASPDDCKIDAILLSRRLMTTFPGKFKTIRVAFYDQDRHNEFWDIQVRASLVNAYAAGKLSQNELLNSISFKEDSQKNPLSSKYASMAYQGIIEAPDVTPGILQDRRLALALRLRSLAAQGVDTKTFQEELLKIEDTARRGQTTGLSARIDKLNNTLNQQTKQLTSKDGLSQNQLNLQHLKEPQTAARPNTTSGIKP